MRKINQTKRWNKELSPDWSDWDGDMLFGASFLCQFFGKDLWHPMASATCWMNGRSSGSSRTEAMVLPWPGETELVG